MILVTRWKWQDVQQGNLEPIHRCVNWENLLQVYAHAPMTKGITRCSDRLQSMINDAHALCYFVLFFHHPFYCSKFATLR